MGALTVYKGAYLPQVAGDSGVWGGLMNTQTFPVFDANLGGFAAISVTNTNVTLSALQDEQAILRVTGTLTGNVQITSACQGFKYVENLTTGAFTLTIIGSTGSAVTLTQGGPSLVIFDATNGARLAVSSASIFGFTPSATGLSLLQAANGPAVKGIGELSQAITASSSTLAINMNLGWNVELTLSANVTTVTVSNWPAANILGRLTLDITSTGSFTLGGWPGTTRWAGGNAYTATASGRDTVVLVSADGGTTFRGFVAALAMS